MLLSQPPFWQAFPASHTQAHHRHFLPLPQHPSVGLRYLRHPVLLKRKQFSLSAISPHLQKQVPLHTLPEYEMLFHMYYFEGLLKIIQKSPKLK